MTDSVREGVAQCVATLCCNDPEAQVMFATEAVRDLCVMSACYQTAPVDTIKVIALLTRLNDGRRLFATPQIRSVLDNLYKNGHGEAGAMRARLQ